mmetsp:Transcript_7825/g.22455  ORF Transcript_7825/g.22455 Transcript_7825/m.22455 type:complete len:212 (-) Transcript_7825:344-979(-)
MQLQVAKSLLAAAACPTRFALACRVAARRQALDQVSNAVQCRPLLRLLHFEGWPRAISGNIRPTIVVVAAARAAGNLQAALRALPQVLLAQRTVLTKEAFPADALPDVAVLPDANAAARACGVAVVVSRALQSHVSLVASTLPHVAWAAADRDVASVDDTLDGVQRRGQLDASVRVRIRGRELQRASRASVLVFELAHTHAASDKATGAVA